MHIHSRGAVLFMWYRDFKGPSGISFLSHYGLYQGVSFAEQAPFGTQAEKRSFLACKGAQQLVVNQFKGA